jgi:hypothetical protein
MVIEEFIQVAAPAARVWQLLADPGRMSTLSPELDRIEWIGAPEPRVGGSFTGHNRVGPIRWSTTNVIETVEPESVFGWRTVESLRVPLDLPPPTRGWRLTRYRAIRDDRLDIRLLSTVGPVPDGSTRDAYDAEGDQDSL